MATTPNQNDSDALLCVSNDGCVLSPELAPASLLPECDDHVNIFKFPNPPSFDIITMTMVTRNRFKRK